MEKSSLPQENLLWRQAEIRILQKGGLAVVCTDTIFGIVGLAKNEGTVRRIYRLKKRNPKKPCIILISSIEDLKMFGVDRRMIDQNVLKEYWPGPVSIIFPTRMKKSLQYLHRGTAHLAFRLPKDKRLRELLRRTGPLVAPSANPEGLPPARNVKEAKQYFGTGIDLYVGGGKPRKKPSKILSIGHGGISVIRA